MADENLKEIKEFKHEIDDVFVLNENLQKINQNAEHIDTQTNNLVILSSALFAFSATGFLSTNSQVHFYLLILALFSSLSAITGLLALNPPEIFIGKRRAHSKFYSPGIAGYKSAEEYFESLKAMLADEKKTIEEYSLEIYNLAKFSYIPKRRLFNASRNILIAGFLLSLVLFVFQIH